jgi:hypothetical protein
MLPVFFETVEVMEARAVDKQSQSRGALRDMTMQPGWDCEQNKRTFVVKYGL